MEVKEKCREMVSGAKNERSKCSTARKKTGMERNLPRSQGLSYAPEEGKTREPGNKE